MLQPISYETARMMMRPGGGVSMGAGGFVSTVIKAWSRPNFLKFWEWSRLSHWAQILTVSAELSEWLVTHISPRTEKPYLSKPRKDRPGDRVVLIESTMMTGMDGVQCHWMSERVEDYHGSVYYHPLEYARQAALDLQKYTQFGLKCVGIPYDKVLIAHDLFDPLGLIPSREDWDAFICSEFGPAMLKAGGVLPLNFNTSDQTPQSMAELGLWGPDYYQLKGKTKEIEKINTRRIA